MPPADITFSGPDVPDAVTLDDVGYQIVGGPNIVAFPLSYDQLSELFPDSGSVGTVEISDGTSDTLYPSEYLALVGGSDPYFAEWEYVGPPCYRKGTRIAGPQGAIAVEDLEIGDLVFAHFAGVALVKWIGCRTVKCSRFPEPRKVWPVRVAADSFRHGSPRCDLWLSPDHAVFVDGALIQIKQLINGASIAQIQTDTVTYFHVELDRHDILLAEGLPAESFLDTGNRGLLQNGGVPMMLHPEFAGDDRKNQSENGCAPLVITDELIEPIWRRLAARSEATGHRIPLPAAVTMDAQLQLLIGGRILKPVRTGENSHGFVLPRNGCEARLISRSCAPADIRPWVGDRRRLGVAIIRVIFHDGGGRSDIPLDHPKLAEGWHDLERDGPRLWRWTDGDASLPVPPGTTMLEIHLAGSCEYALPSEEAINSARTRAA